MDDAVKKAFDAKKGRSGSPGLTLDLADAGQQYDRKTVAESMRRQGLRAKAARKFKATTNSKHGLPVAPNLLQQDFTATATQPEVRQRHHVLVDRRGVAVPGHRD